MEKTICMNCKYHCYVPRCGYLQHACLAPALVKIDYVTGSAVPELCDLLNKTGECPQFKAVEPPKPQPKKKGWFSWFSKDEAK